MRQAGCVAKLSDLQQLGAPGRPALGPASGKMLVETAWCVWLRRNHVALWQFVEPHPFCDCVPVEPRLTDNRADAMAGKLLGFHSVEHVRIDGPAASRDQKSVFHQRWLPSMTHPSSDDHGLGLGIRRRQGLPRGPRSAAQLLLDRLTEVLQQVETIGHLIGLRRALSTLGVETASIPADDLYTGMPTQPSAGGLDRAVGQHIDDLALLEVDHDRPVTRPLLPGPVINPDHPQRRSFILRAGMTLETAQDRVIALRQSQARHQALCRTTARGVAEKPGQIGHPEVLRADGWATSGSRSLNVCRSQP